MAKQTLQIPRGRLPRMLFEAERQLLIDALQTTQGHRHKTAARLGISRNSLQRKLRVHGLTKRGRE